MNNPLLHRRLLVLLLAALGCASFTGCQEDRRRTVYRGYDDGGYAGGVAIYHDRGYGYGDVGYRSYGYGGYRDRDYGYARYGAVDRRRDYDVNLYSDNRNYRNRETINRGSNYGRYDNRTAVNRTAVNRTAVYGNRGTVDRTPSYRGNRGRIPAYGQRPAATANVSTRGAAVNVQGKPAGKHRGDDNRN